MLDELGKARVQVEADMVAQGVQQLDIAVIKSYIRDLRDLLLEAGLTERKAFLRSFIKRIDIDENKVTVQYKLTLPQGGQKDTESVLPIDTLSGDGVIIGRTFELEFSLTI